MPSKNHTDPIRTRIIMTVNTTFTSGIRHKSLQLGLRPLVLNSFSLGVEKGHVTHVQAFTECCLSALPIAITSS